MDEILSADKLVLFVAFVIPGFISLKFINCCSLEKNSQPLTSSSTRLRTVASTTRY